MKISYQSIGTIFTPFKSVEGMPIQPSGAEGIEGTIEILPEFVEGLKDLDGFSHVILLYHLHRVTSYSLSVVPFLDKVEHGIFATRAPKRPNAIGLSIVSLSAVKGNKLFVKNIDVLDGTPLLDIKPYVPDFDQVQATSTGWFEKNVKRAKTFSSDDRFKDK
ncbi:tRNA (N6-threonylcarbamoyladenosine(37)-N6)-methyltransferase TrmO [bacterium]|nr:tRNA (N6-threonylcarbamoyladenosine(37)-N6)-methyltransferase TrmO [bacterium]